MEKAKPLSIYRPNEDYYSSPGFKINEFIEEARILLEKKDFKNSEFNLNLAKLDPKIDFNLKIKIIGMTSLIKQTQNDDTNLLMFIIKIIKYLKNKSIKIMDVNTAYFIIRIFFRVGIQMHLNKNYMLSIFCLKQSAMLINEKGIQGEDKNLKTADQIIEENMNLMKPDLEKIKENYLNISEDFLWKINSIKKIYNDYERNLNLTEKKIIEIEKIKNWNKENEEEKEKEEEKEEVYIISKNWFNKAICFIDEITNKYSLRSKDDLFDLNKFFSKFLLLEKDSRKINNTYGIYPGPINNFHLLNSKEFWFDPCENNSYMNNILNKTVIQKEDFFILEKKEWDLIKEVFNCLYEIKRYRSIKTKEIDIYPKEYKLIILSSEMRKNFIEEIKLKTLYASKNDNINDLKEKIFRSYRNLMEKNSQKINENLKAQDLNLLQMYNAKGNGKRLLVNLIYHYKIFAKKFRVPGKFLTENDTNLEKIDFDQNIDILIADIDTNFIEVDKICVNPTEINCIICKNSIEENNLVECPNCKNFQYCSMSCLKEDEIHRNFHILIKKFSFPKLKLKDLQKLSLEEIIDKESSFGRVGLKNLGNTCFMNSALQCLSHCEDLTKYFLLKHHLKDINSQNKYGSSGQVAIGFYELLNNLWTGNSANLSPNDFRQNLVKIIKRFQGFSQQDSHELLTYLLDTLHEDLNRVTEKPYIEMKDQTPEETDLQASNRCWENHLRRENSIIVDLFHGQFKSTIKCPECKNISITYDPFMCLGLPIANNKGNFYVKYFPNFFRKLKHEYHDIELCANFPSMQTVRDLKIDIHEKFGEKKNGKMLIKSPLLFLCYEAILVNKEKIYIKTLNDETEILQFLKDDFEVIFYEKYGDNEQIKNSNDYKSFIFNPISIKEEFSYYFIKQNKKINLFYPMIITINVNCKLFDLYYLLFLAYRKIVPDEEKIVSKEFLDFSVNEKFDDNNNNDLDKDNLMKIRTDKEKFFKIFLSEEKNEENEENDEKYLMQEFKTYFYLDLELKFKENEVPFDLYFFNSANETKSYLSFFYSNNVCEFCKVKNCEFCRVDNYSKINENISNIISFNKINKEQSFLINFKSYDKEKFCKDLYFPISENEEKNIYCKNNSNNNKNNNSISIYDCLNQFKKEEKLERENTWYCNICKKQQEALKKIEIFRAPRILIIQLKRFKVKSQFSISDELINGKNESLIDYPVEDLDLSNYIVGENKDNVDYSLFAISQHFGNLSSGHYTSLCKNKGKWIEFDDENISNAEDKDIVNNFAYLLFYKVKSN